MNCCFYMGTYQDQKLAQQTLQQLRQLYPIADILACSDGINNQEFVQFCRNYKIGHLIGERLKLAKFGGEWVIRMLVDFLHYSHAAMLIKLDPDARVNRQFNSVPSGDVIGNIRPCPNGHYIQGGCMGLTRRAVYQLVESECLNDPIYATEPFTYNPGTLAYGSQSSDRLIASDLILSNASQRLGLTWGEWGEICSHATTGRLAMALAGFSVEQIRKQYAVIHPVKQL